MSWLNYHHLMYFKTIATEGSISKASEKLLVGQPALSAQLKNLEEAFGHQLFERRNRKLFLTDAGRAALKYANQISSLGLELQEVLKDKSFAVKPHINIGVMDSIPKQLIVSLVKEAKSFENCKITVLDGSGEDLQRELVTHTIDIAVTNHHLHNMEADRLYTKSVGKASIAVFAAEKHKKLKKGFPGSLMGQDLILPTSHSKLRHDVEHYLEESGILCNLFVDTQDTAVQKLLAAEGLGLIVEPEFAVKHYLKDKKLVKLGILDGVFEEYFLIAAKRTVENPVAKHLLSKFRPKFS